MAAVGREFRFPFDVKIYPTPSLNNLHNGTLYKYLRNVGKDSKFSLSLLQILIEERRATYHNQYKKDKVVSFVSDMFPCGFV